MLARVNRGGTPWVAMAFVGVTAMALALGGTFNSLLALSITLILLVDSIAVLALLVLRRRAPDAPFRTPLYPALPLAFIGVYGALFVMTTLAQPKVVLVSVAVIAVAYLLAWLTARNQTST